MMKKLLFVLLPILVLNLFSCAKVYYSPDAKSRASKHQLIAIAPPKVSIAARKKVEAEAMKEQQKTESLNFQNEMYSWLLRRKMQNRINVEILDLKGGMDKKAKNYKVYFVKVDNDLSKY